LAKLRILRALPIVSILPDIFGPGDKQAHWLIAGALENERNQLIGMAAQNGGKFTQSGVVGNIPPVLKGQRKRIEVILRTQRRLQTQLNNLVPGETLISDLPSLRLIVRMMT